MAATYTILSQMPVVELVPPNRTRTVHEVTAQADPSGVIFYLRFLPTAYTPGTVARDVAAVAGGLNRDANVPGVVGLRIEQDTDANGQLVEYGVATVESTTGNSQTEIRDRQGWLFLDTFKTRVKAARDKLDAIEDL